MNKIELKKVLEELGKKPKLEFQEIQNYLKSIFPPEYTFTNFYNVLIIELFAVLKEIDNDIQKENFFIETNQQLNYLYRILNLFFFINRFCSQEEVKEIINEKNINALIEIFINLLNKINSIDEECKKKKEEIKIFTEMERLSKYIYTTIKLCLDVNLNFLFERSFTNKDKLFPELLKNIYTRTILYEILRKILSCKNGKDGKDNKFKMKELLIIDILNHLEKICAESNLTIVVEDLKRILRIYRRNLVSIRKTIFNLIKIIIDLYKKEMNKEYEDLFTFFFSEIVFDLNEEFKEGQIPSDKKFNIEFLDILFELYNYLLSNKNMKILEMYLIRLFLSIENDVNEDNKKTTANDKYKWLEVNTDYIKVVLYSFPEIFDKTFFTYYFLILMKISNNHRIICKSSNNLKEGLKKNDFLPEIDFVFLFRDFQKYLDNIESKEDFINYFTQKLTDLMNDNKEIVKILLQKCNVFQTFISVIEKEDDNNIRTRLFEFIDKIILINKERYDYTLGVDIRDNLNGINLKINTIAIGYELDNSKFNDKLMRLINRLNTCCEMKKVEEFIQYLELIFTIIKDYKFRKISVIIDDFIMNLNSCLLKISQIFSNSQINDLTKKDDELEQLLTKYLNTIFKFIFQLNMKKFEYKAQKGLEQKPIYFTKKIIEKKL